MYRDYAIMREPGPQARANRRQWDPYFSPRAKRVGTANGSCEVEALYDYEHEKYIASWNPQWAGSRMEWTTERRYPDGWRVWDRVSDPGTRGRVWRLVVTLRNGRNEHEAIFYAWRDER